MHLLCSKLNLKVNVGSLKNVDEPWAPSTYDCQFLIIFGEITFLCSTVCYTRLGMQCNDTRFNVNCRFDFNEVSFCLIQTASYCRADAFNNLVSVVTKAKEISRLIAR